MKESMRAKLTQMRDRFSELDSLLAQPEVTSDLKAYRALSRDHAQLGSIVERLAEYEQSEKDLVTAQAMSKDPEMAEFAFEEIVKTQNRMIGLTGQLERMLLPVDPNDSKNLYLEIRAGTGGDESALFAADLARMYIRFAERQHWKVEIMSQSASDLGGYKEVILRIEGNGAFAKLKFESGGHRVQRVPQTETQGRIHTSACTVAAMPEADDAEEIVIKPEELRIDVYRASGAGGQHVNKTESAVRITHLPTNTVVAIQNERSQLQNKETAMKILRGKLAQMRMEQHAETLADLRAGESASWGAQIRNYVLHPYTMVKDARTKHETRDAAGVLDGKIDEFIDAYLEAHSGVSD